VKFWVGKVTASSLAKLDQIRQVQGWNKMITMQKMIESFTEGAP
jgi:hypothetical protein